MINLDRIQDLIDSNRLDPNKPISIAELYKAGIENIQDGIKILARGNFKFKSKIFIQATKFSQEAIKKIEELGGTAVSVYHTSLGLRVIKNPNYFIKKSCLSKIPKFAAPVKNTDLLYYSDPKYRGYLLPDLWNKICSVNKDFENHYVKVDPIPIPEKPVLLKDFLSGASKFPE